MKILVCELSQETNSFSPVVSRVGDFLSTFALSAKTNGASDYLKSKGHTIVEGPFMRAQSSGKMDHAVVDKFLDETRKAIKANEKVDAIAISLHGASQSTKEDDVCGFVCETLKREFGVPISASFDLHANITRKIIDNTVGVAGYQTYPHRDFYDTGRRSAILLQRHLEGKRTYCSYVRIPMIAPASGYTTDDGPLSELYKEANGLIAEGRIIDYSMFQMQPWLDVYDAGSTIVFTAEDEETARSLTLSFSERMKTMGDNMQPQLDSMEDVIKAVRSNDTNRPVVVSDFSDSPNAGSVGDNVDILDYVLTNAPDISMAFIVSDDRAVETAYRAGVGGEATFTVGGTIDRRNKAVTFKAVVRSLHDGKVFGLGGTYFDIGKTAVISVGSIDIVVTYKIRVSGSIQLYRQFGVEPEFYQLVIVKANTSFRLVYSPIAARIMVVDTRCASTADLRSLPWEHLPKAGFYPFEDISSFDVESHMVTKTL